VQDQALALPLVEPSARIGSARVEYNFLDFKDKKKKKKKKNKKMRRWREKQQEEKMGKEKMYFKSLSCGINRVLSSDMTNAAWSGAHDHYCMEQNSVAIGWYREVEWGGCAGKRHKLMGE
jgi:hypothetical protein